MSGGALAAVDGWPVPAAAAAVVDASGVRATRGPVDRGFPLASVTKPLAALAVLVAAEEEAVSLEDPADERVVPGATLRHLLAHASGLAPERPLRSYPPATRRVYSNVGIERAAALVEAGADMPFPAYLEQAVAAPLGLRSTSLPGSAARDGVSSVADLARVAFEVLTRGPLLAAATWDDLGRVQYPGLRGVLPGYGGQDPNDWGLGWELRGGKRPHWTGTANSPATIGHFGQSGTFVWVDPVAGLALVVLTDRRFGDWSRDAWPALSDAVLAAYA